MRIRPNRVKKAGAVPAPSMQVAPPPQVQRSKPRIWLFVVAALFGLLGWWVWDQFLRTSAYALVEVDEISISTPLDGLIASMSVKEDGIYEAGTIAFTVVDRDTRDELEALRLELRLIESQIAERSMNLKLSQADRLYERDELIAERRADLGKAQFERDKLRAGIARMTAEVPAKEFELTRIKNLVKQGAATEQEWITARYEYEAAAKELEGLIAAQEAAITQIEALRGAIERPVPAAPEIEVGVEPLRRQAALVRRRIEQLHAKLLQSEVRMSAPGKVTRIISHPGEFVRAGDPVLTVTRPSTIRVVAYCDQTDTRAFEVNENVRIVTSYAPETSGRVVRLGAVLKIGPEPIARFHPKGEPIFPIEIEVDSIARKHLVPGSVVRVLPTGISFSPRKAMAD